MYMEKKMLGLLLSFSFLLFIYSLICQAVAEPKDTDGTAISYIYALEEPFCRVVINCVGPIPKTTKRNQYLLTIMCASTRFPEAMPIRTLSTKRVAKFLYYSRLNQGSPVGPRDMSQILQQVRKLVNIHSL